MWFVHDRAPSDHLPTQWLAFDVLPDLVIVLTMTVLPLGDVKSHLSELVSRVHDYHERVTVTVHGRPSAVLIAPEDLERLEETLEIMRDAATMNRLAESDAELARGEHVSAGELAEAMRQRGRSEQGPAEDLQLQGDLRRFIVARSARSTRRPAALLRVHHRPAPPEARAGSGSAPDGRQVRAPSYPGHLPNRRQGSRCNGGRRRPPATYIEREQPRITRVAE